MKQKVRKIILSAVMLIGIYSCGPNVNELAIQSGDKYLQELNNLDKDQPLNELIDAYSSIVYLNESDVASTLINEEIIDEDKNLFLTIVDDKISKTKIQIDSIIQVRNKEGFELAQGKTWIVNDTTIEDRYKAIFSINKEQLEFLNIKGSYGLKLNSSSNGYELDGSNIVFEKLTDNEVRITKDIYTEVFSIAEEKDLILGSFSDRVRYFGSNIYFTLNFFEANKATLYGKGPGGKQTYPVRVKAKGNSRYSFSDRTGSVTFKYANNHWKGKIDVNLNLKRNQKEEANSSMSIFSGLTVEEIKKRERKAEKEDNSMDSYSDDTANSDWETTLEEYEEFIDKYVDLLKKATSNPGDLTLVSEYTTYMQKAQGLGTKLSSAQGNLSASQVAKFMKLQTKLMNAALELSK